MNAACRSTGCGDLGCLLCQYNPSRLCTRNLKQKYLIDDHLKAKCGAALRVELVDDSGACYAEGLPPGVQLEVRPCSVLDVNLALSREMSEPHSTAAYRSIIAC